MSERKPLEVLIINSKEDDRQEWLALPTDADKVRALFDRLGIELVYRSQGPKADYYISAVEHLPFPELDASTSTWNIIDGVNWLASRLEALDEKELATVRAAMAVGCFYRLQDVIALTYNAGHYTLLQNVHTEADLGRYHLHESGMVQMPEEWKAGIDPVRFGAQIAEQEQGRFAPQGYLALSGSEWKEIDRTQIPEEYRAEFGKPTREKQSVRDALKAAKAAPEAGNPAQRRGRGTVDMNRP